MLTLPFLCLVHISCASVLQLNVQHFKEHINKDPEKVFNHSADGKLFLGDEAENFQKLYPEETKKRLGMIVDRIDADADGQVSVDELTEWIDYIHKDHIKRDVEREWVNRNPDKVEKLSWSRLVSGFRKQFLLIFVRYKQNVYGFLNDKSTNIPTNSLQEMVDRDDRRWRQADQDGDGNLNIVEFQES